MLIKKMGEVEDNMGGMENKLAIPSILKSDEAERLMMLWEGEFH